MTAAPLAAIRRQVMWTRLIAVVEEQAQALLRTAFGSVVREAGDLSAGVYDTRGRMLAQAVTGTPGHVNTMAMAVGHFLERFPVAAMQPGDVFVTNDPWMGTGHLFDYVVVTPVFGPDADGLEAEGADNGAANRARDGRAGGPADGGWDDSSTDDGGDAGAMDRGRPPHGRAIALVASTCHVTDVGGRGFSADATSVFEEGTLIPHMRLRTAGGPNEDLFAIIAANSRNPVEVMGDLRSLVSCNDTGAARLRDMMREFDLARLDALADYVLAASEAATRRAIGALPDGRYAGEMTLDGYEAPIRLKARLDVEGEQVRLDYAGSSPASRYGINSPKCYTDAYSVFGLKCVIAPDVPNNAGSLGCFRVDAPAGSCVAPERPSPVTARHVIGQMLPDLVFGCLAQAVPGRTPAESAGSIWVLAMSSAEGGAGAGPRAVHDAPGGGAPGDARGDGDGPPAARDAPNDAAAGGGAAGGRALGGAPPAGAAGGHGSPDTGVVVSGSREEGGRPVLRAADGDAPASDAWSGGGAGDGRPSREERRPSTRFNVMNVGLGGVGAGPAWDGLSTTAFPSGVGAIPVEVTESESPLLYRRKELLPDSGGPGRFRGGLSQIIEIASTEDAPFLVSAATWDRLRFPAAGRAGGGPGRGGSARLGSGPPLEGKARHRIPAGDTLVVELPGGGGFGDPRDRPAAALEADLAAGYVTPDSARRHYRKG